MNIRAEISAEALNFATRRNRAHCAIAYALASAYPNFRRIEVDYNTIRLTDAETRLRYIYRTPEAQREFIAKWDDEKPVANPPAVKLERRHLVRVNEPRERKPEDVLRPRTSRERQTPATPRHVRPRPGSAEAA